MAVEKERKTLRLINVILKENNSIGRVVQPVRENDPEKVAVPEETVKLFASISKA